MTRERIYNLWRPDVERAPAPADMVKALAAVSFDAFVLISLRGNVPATRREAALDYLRQVAREFNSHLVEFVGSSKALAAVAHVNESQTSLTLFSRARIVFAFDEDGLRGKAPTHFYRGLPVVRTERPGPETTVRAEPCLRPSGCYAHWGVTCSEGHIRLSDCPHWTAPAGNQP